MFYTIKKFECHAYKGLLYEYEAIVWQGLNKQRCLDYTKQKHLVNNNNLFRYEAFEHTGVNCNKKALRIF